MAFFLSKFLGKNSTNSKIDSNDSIEAIIKDVENTPYGVSQNNVLYAGLNELGGYYFFQTIIVGQLRIKTKQGASLVYIGDNFKLNLESDMPEFESENSGVKGRYVTKVDFKIEKEDINTLENAKLNSVQLKVNKHQIIFTKYIMSDEEE